jgi:4-carboxymuconolactone decarboxylase
MEKKDPASLAVLWVLLLGFAAIAGTQTMNVKQALSAQQQRIIPIAALTANGDLAKLRTRPKDLWP